MTCGPQCVYATLASAAEDSGWQVASTRDAAASIAGALGGIYQGVLGVASLDELEKAFSLLPPFAMPIAAVPVVDGLPAGADSIPVGNERRRGMRSGCSACLALLEDRFRLLRITCHC